MKDFFVKILGEELRKLRLIHHYTQFDLAIIVNKSQSSYSLFECGKQKPAIDELYRLAAYYGLTVDDILRKCIDLDNEIFFNSLEPDYDKIEKLGYVSFTRTKIDAALASKERELLFHFNKLGTAAKDEIIANVKFKRTL